MVIDQTFGREQRLLNLAIKLELGTADQDEVLEAANALSHTAGDRLRLEHRVNALELGLAFFMRIMEIFANARADLLWNITDGFPQFAVDCSSMFDRGSVDAEPLTPENLHILEQAVRDVQQIPGMADSDWGSTLFVARIRGRRPRGLFPEQLQALFDAVGPPR
jgi:hypothetical protein